MTNETVPKDILDILSAANIAKASTMTYGAITVEDTATQILATQAGRAGLLIVNNSGKTVYIGGAAVTTLTGIPVVAGGSYENQDWVGALYGIVSSGTANVRVEEFY